ncbi:MAG: tail fiber domain-containing protein, partial [Anaerolineae bacterium]|nr:tail fiber domain-containing protein [Anaerolineae bacterium]
SSAWQPVPAPSDRNLKENIQPVDVKDILKRLLQVPIAKWNYIADQPVPHIGPMAQDFYAAFGVGEDELHISTIDANGVALAAIQGLYQIVQEKDAQIAAQQKQIDDLQARLSALEALVAQLAKEGGR